ncbi:hypothetical protein SO802_010715 [Lithocarpus litseifolius]|uniref:RNase H type-1 domain-containing protein n=1 Tax=Lithocarpus litseifolius TaxID=425828 RepID=A0AAW2DEZ3_9ROSI
MGNLSSEFFSLDIHSWLEENCKLDKRPGYLQIPRSTLFAFGVWILWQHMNRVVFKNFTPNQNIHKEIVQRAAEFAYCAQNMAASKLRINALEIELDALAVADLMGNSRNSKAVYFAIVADYRLLISQVPQVKVLHCYQETNGCADGLTRLGSQQASDILYHNFPPSCLRDLFLSDLYGVYHFRLCPNTDVSASYS